MGVIRGFLAWRWREEKGRLGVIRGLLLGGRGKKEEMGRARFLENGLLTGG